jgi:PAS domain-containing protein
MRFVEDGLVRGQYLVLDVHKAPLLDESGNMVGTVGCGRDITRERQIQKDLEEIRASQQLLMETASDFAVFRLRAIRVRPRGLNVIFVSPSAKDIAGITEPMKPERWFQVHPDDRKAMRYAYVKGYSVKIQPSIQDFSSCTRLLALDACHRHLCQTVAGNAMSMELFSISPNR